MKPTGVKELEKIFRGVGNSRRLSIIRLLTKEDELDVTEIASRIKLSFTSTSKHLNLLHRLDILDRRQKELNVYYRLADSPPPVIKKLLLYIA